MPTLLNLVQKVRALDVGLDEIPIPYRWFREIIANAEELAGTEDDNEEDDIY
ncbi:hypothetical protein ACFLTV_01160 [Chloroflexota bacterium]